jgi:excisionase family DNA binding protein
MAIFSFPWKTHFSLYIIPDSFFNGGIFDRLPRMPHHLTSRQVAQALGVSESSVKRWCDRGLLNAYRTGGGHRRVPFGGVVQFIRATGHPLAEPELLGMPPQTGERRGAAAQAMETVVDLLAEDDAEGFRRFCFDLYLNGIELVRIFDEVLAPAFERLGDRWRQGSLQIHEERRACEVAMQVLNEFRRMLPHPAPDAPWSMGGTLAGDPYMLSTTMAELTMRESGWRATHCGYGLPAGSLARALTDRRPRLFWLSVSSIPSAESFMKEYGSLYHTALTLGITVAVGGRGITAELRNRIECSVWGDRLGRLAEAARILFSPGSDAVA